MNQTFPDIEIYIKDADVNAVLAWLDVVFDSIEFSKRGQRILITLNSSRGLEDCVLLPNAVKGNFASLWFKSGNTSWDTDRDCALDAFSYLNQEIRCSTSGWDSSETDTGEGDASETVSDDRWLRIDSSGESLLQWQT
jgi:hypothetical protein